MFIVRPIREWPWWMKRGAPEFPHRVDVFSGSWDTPAIYEAAIAQMVAAYRFEDYLAYEAWQKFYNRLEGYKYEH